MWDALLSFLDHNTGRWSTLIPFANAVVRLRTLRTEASTAGQRQEHGSEGSTQNKAAMSDRMVANAMLIANNAHAYAIVAEDRRLEAATDFSPSTLRRMTDARRADAIDAMINAVSPAISQMAGYPVTASQISDLQRLVQAYRSTIGEPGEDIANRKTATATADDVRREGQHLIKKVLDKLVRNFEASDPDFVRNYFNARVVRDMGHRGSSPGGTATQP